MSRLIISSAPCVKRRDRRARSKKGIQEGDTVRLYEIKVIL